MMLLINANDYPCDFRAEKDKDAINRDSEDAKSAVDALTRDKVQNAIRMSNISYTCDF